jgi:hypothetical protein
MYDGPLMAARKQRERAEVVVVPISLSRVHSQHRAFEGHSRSKL